MFSSAASGVVHLYTRCIDNSAHVVVVVVSSSACSSDYNIRCVCVCVLNSHGVENRCKASAAAAVAFTGLSAQVYNKLYTIL